MATVGETLKKGQETAVALFKKGTETVKGWFGKGDIKKVPYLMEKLQATQATLHEKQTQLLSMQSRAGSSAAIAGSYLQERTNDLVQARNENMKYLQDLEACLADLSKKKIDFSKYKSAIQTVRTNQAAIDKNQDSLRTKLAQFWPKDAPKAAGSSGEANAQDVAQRFGTPENPYAAAGAAADGAADGTSYGSANRDGSENLDGVAQPAMQGELTHPPAASNVAATLKAAAPKAPSPNDPTVAGYIDEWCNRKGLDEFGRFFVAGVTMSAGPPDTGGLNRHEYIWAHHPAVHAYVQARLNGENPSIEPAHAKTAAATRSSDRPKPSKSSTPKAASDKGFLTLQETLTANSPADAEKIYRDYVKQDETNRSNIQQQHQATSDY